jgi:hypothetical protein
VFPDEFAHPPLIRRRSKSVQIDVRRPGELPELLGLRRSPKNRASFIDQRALILGPVNQQQRRPQRGDVIDGPRLFAHS